MQDSGGLFAFLYRECVALTELVKGKCRRQRASRDNSYYREAEEGRVLGQHDLDLKQS